MATTREQIMLAVLAKLQTVPGGVHVLRNADLPLELPAAGMIVLRDGKAGEAEVLLGSPRTYLWDRVAEIVVVAGDANPDEAKSKSDTLIQAIETALGLEADSTIGGLCESAELGEPDFDDVAPDGALPMRGATLPLTLSYATATALG